LSHASSHFRRLSQNPHTPNGAHAVMIVVSSARCPKSIGLLPKIPRGVS
jgi:hypothetical protein